VVFFGSIPHSDLLKSVAPPWLTSTQVVEFWVDPQCRLRWS